MFCQNCGKEMDDKLKSCPNCGTPAKPKKKKVKVMWVIPAVIAAFVLIGVLSSGGSDDEPHAVNNGETVSSNAATEPQKPSLRLPKNPRSPLAMPWRMTESP